MANLDDGFYVKNSTLYGVRNGFSIGVPSRLRFEAYDANSQRITQNSPVIELNNMRYISTKHIGTADHIYLLCFYDTEHYNPPPGIGLIADGHGSSGGGGFSISIGGYGFGASGSGGVSVTDAFSQPSLVARMELKTYNTPGGGPSYPKTHRWSCLEVITGINDKGDDVLQAVFVKDALTGEEVGPPNWNRTWDFSAIGGAQGS